MTLSEFCQAVGIKQKHLRKVERFYAEVPPSVQGKRVVNLCAGDSLLAWYFLIEGATEQVLSIDLKSTKKYRALRALIKKERPEIDAKYTFLERDIYDPDLGLQATDFIVGLHACGNLTDRIIGLALEAGSSFAIMPCCYRPDRQLLRPTQYQIPSGKSREEIVDQLRLGYIKERGREVILREVKDFPSPMNRLLLSHI
jgi:hypothetical protein